MPDEKAPSDEPESNNGWGRILDESSERPRRVRQVLGRAVLDLAYRELFFRDRPAALREFGLSEDDSGFLDVVDRQSFEAAVEGLVSELVHHLDPDKKSADQIGQLAGTWEGSLEQILDEGSGLEDALDSSSSEQG